MLSHLNRFLAARSRRRLLACLAVAGSVLAMPVTALAEPAAGVAPPTPAALHVPDDQALLFRVFATGSQIYDCATSSTGADTWAFRQPAATLTDEAGDPVGIHGRGPFWASFDGSAVVGSAPTSAPGADPANDIPLLLLHGTPNNVTGRFADVTYIQRLQTSGGMPPLGTCDPDAQPSLAVPYTAVYYFYGPARVS